MRIVVVGTGYVGLVVGACLAETGNDVVCADVHDEKIEGLTRGVLPIFEPGLEELVRRNASHGRLTFTTDIPGAVRGAEVAFIAVGTPPDEDGSADLRHVLAVAEQVGRHMTRELVIVTKSTVPVGTAARVGEAVERHARFPFHLCSNPEFLKEGAAVEDFLRPDRVVLGAESDHARSVMAELYAPFVRTGKPIIFMDIASAEMTKYAANAMLATRISFMNEIANLCERVGANVDLVRRGVGSDGRIGAAFLFPGPGYGGSCFPKDVAALVRAADTAGAPLRILRAVEEANARQKERAFEKLAAAFAAEGLAGRRVAVWGLAFKAQTDDMRESPSLSLVERLLAVGAEVVAHDPAALGEARRRLEDRVALVENGYDALDGADALVVMTDWNEYRHPNFRRMAELLRRPVLVDARNLYDPARMRALGFDYRSIGREPEPAVAGQSSSTPVVSSLIQAR
ncbi:UDP-glucose/GDP-mannose dehydrogenase family protein [Roseisolibacter sp. H3M3-2]|uniref:UDP-glucose dehydrogenase family protein n=1 Tax=Roseisolibacter sp. H3M3-2 TaxID=3031323 RepID=UPI0023DAB26C|nr:UDP-glucose/GDP-mannose dehydrogenase family protein [Roseisolibacter sp. H3M3-2]MDF1503209.1 UDP-glucose/GDP-mannose dehydrogenase family protein [Roseisolibacter sp. H3M3-2]